MFRGRWCFWTGAFVRAIGSLVRAPGLLSGCGAGHFRMRVLRFFRRVVFRGLRELELLAGFPSVG